MHELDGDVAGLLRDLVDFLECLGEVKLSDDQQSTRDALLAQSRILLERSPEPYLDMSAGKGSLQSADETDQRQEYIDAYAPSQHGSLQHYYETFQDFGAESKSESQQQVYGSPKKDRDSLDDVLLLYASFSAAQAKDKAAKLGPLLHLKGERKMFAPFNVFWLNKQQCWVALVGLHLLLYGSERDVRPYLVLPLQGYKGRGLARDARRNEAAFEIYCPGERTFQFAAKNVQEMKEWLDAVTKCLEPEAVKSKTHVTTFSDILELETNERMCIERVKEEKEKYQDVFGSLKTKVKTTTPIAKEESCKENAPALPARSRRLPSLPSQEQVTTYEPREELYDEEGLYQRIEDIKAQREYQNCQVARAISTETCDTVVDLPEDDGAVWETYDDVQQITDTAVDSVESYEDIQAVLKRGAGESRVGKSVTAKRSFLDRVRNRKDSPKKEEKKSPTTPLPCQDEVSREKQAGESVEEEYLSPPPPRPIYSTPPAIVKCTRADDTYDDIGCRGCANVDVIKNYPKNGSFLSDLQLSINQVSAEHYQVPKAANRRVSEESEETYDDVTLSESFKNRQRDSTPVSERSVWSRFSNGKRPRIFDHLGKQNSCNESNEAIVETGELQQQQQQQTKVKSFQKLISKMENSLGMASKANGVT